MTDSSRNEFASAFKWIFVIIVATFAYNTVAPNYYFMRQGPNLYRGNKMTGVVEYLEDNEWVNFTESLLAQSMRLERRKHSEELVKKYHTKSKKDPLDFLHQ